MIDATYFDGQTTRRHAVTVVIQKRVVSMRGEGIHRTVRMSQLDISERLAHAPRILRFPEGGFIEANSLDLEKLLTANHYREPWVVRWQNNWHLSLLALVCVLALLIVGYQWGMPWVANRVAEHLPRSMETAIGDHAMISIDEELMQPSKLAAADQARLRDMFSQLKQPRGEKTAYRLEFRDSLIGSNAFALPNGMIVMTDQLVQLAGNDQAILGVLAHELGHLQRRHMLRRLLQALGVGAVLNLWVGDVSSVLAAVPTFLLDQKYSRDFERESDQYAIEMMQANRLPLSPLADLFEKMKDGKRARRTASPAADKSSEMQDEGADEENGPDEENDARGQNQTGRPAQINRTVIDYFSSHPSDDERIARLRAADKLL
jgi:Zn-dependent protease with chaperone function